MKIFKNKHTLIAVIVAPFLAIVGYYAGDYWVSTTPSAAVAGRSYPLVEQSNCRDANGDCGLENGDFRLNITAETLSEQRLLLNLGSAFTLEGVKMALVGRESEQSLPVAMEPRSDDGRQWTLEIESHDPSRERLRLVAASAGALYFGDVSMRFTQRCSVQEASSSEPIEERCDR